MDWKKLNKKIIFSLSLLGVLMGFLYAIGVSGDAEYYIWIVIAIINITVLVKAGGTVYQNGFVSGFIVAFIGLISRSIFIPAPADKLHPFGDVLFLILFYAAFIALTSWVIARTIKSTTTEDLKYDKYGNLS